MTARRDRLSRLLAIRNVALRAASRDLGRAIGSTAAITALARRIGELQVELTPTVVLSTGQQLKATAATRNGLRLAAARQLARLDAATAHQADATRAVQRDRAATEAVERAIERRDAEAREVVARLVGDQPARKLGR